MTSRGSKTCARRSRGSSTRTGRTPSRRTGLKSFSRRKAGWKVMDNEVFEAMPRGGFKRIKEIREEYVDTAILEKVTLSYVKKNMVMPLKVKDGHLLVALAGPRGIFTVNELERITGFPVKPVFSDEKERTYRKRGVWGRGEIWGG